MPGGGSNFAFYSADESGDELQSFAAYFALRGIDVWGYSPRTRGLAAGACSGAVDCSGMRDWGMQSSTLALLNAAPDAWAGAVVWEGMLYSRNPVVRNANQVVCDDLETQIAGGALWDDTTYPGSRPPSTCLLEQPSSAG